MRIVVRDHKRLRSRTIARLLVYDLLVMIKPPECQSGVSIIGGRFGC